MKILACTDGSVPAEKAVNVAAQLANVSDSELIILHVIESDKHQDKPNLDQYGEKYNKAKSIIKNAEKVASQVGSGIHLNSKIVVGPPSEEIVRIAEQEGTDALFIGTKGVSFFRRKPLGSVAYDVVLYAHCPITVVR